MIANERPPTPFRTQGKVAIYWACTSPSKGDKKIDGVLNLNVNHKKFLGNPSHLLFSDPSLEINK